MELLKIPRMIDISGVRTDVTAEEIGRIAAVAQQFRLICAFAMPCFTPKLVDLLKRDTDIHVGGVISFPSGAETTSIKVATARELISMGVDELDMVINVGALKSGLYDLVRDDIHAVVETAEGRPVKSILEISYLTDDEIRRASTLAVEAGVTFVKTGTGWGPRPTTVETICLIRSTIGDAAKIKAAGGVRTLDTLLAMQAAGCSRFGIGLNSIGGILREAYARAERPLPDGPITEL